MKLESQYQLGWSWLGNRQHLYRTVLENVETGLCLPVFGRGRHHSLERKPMVCKSLQQRENTSGSGKVNAGKRVPVKRIIFFICKRMYMYQMRHQAKFLTGFGKNLHSRKSSIFPKKLDLLICFKKGWFTNEKNRKV